MAVVAFHVGHLRGGYLGVDLFFVLSGFLITSLLLAEGGTTGRIGLARFWERRARRLLPALGVLLVGVALYARFVARPEELHRIRWDGIATLFYVANWRDVVARTDYWSLFTAPSPLDHTWSLAIEEQFYLVWPLVFVVLVGRSRRRTDVRADLATRTLITCGVLAAVSLIAAAFWQHVSGWQRVYYGTDTRAFAILVGGAVAAAVVRFGPVPAGAARRLLEGCGLGGGLVLVAAWLRAAGTSPVVHHGGLAACSVAGALVIAAAVQPQRGILTVVLSWWPLRWLGLLSYGIYLYHWPVIVWLDADRVHLTGWPLIAVQLGVTLLVAWVSWAFIEQPIRRGRVLKWVSPRTVPVLAVAGFGCAAVVILVATTGYRSLNAPQVDPSLSTAAPSAEGARVMIVGDSIADLLAREGFAYLHANPQPTLSDQAVPACSEPPTALIRYVDGTVSGAFAGHCGDGWAAATARFAPDDVVYVVSGAAAVEYQHDGRWLEPCTTAYGDWVVARLTDISRTFEARGARFLVTTSPPQERRGRSDEAYAAYLRANSCWNAAVRRAAKQLPKPDRLIDLDAWLCPTHRTCRTETDDGTVLRPDGEHFRGRAAMVVAHEILARMGIPSTLPDRSSTG